MICITLAFALLVLIAGLFLLAYSKKEGLGWMFKLASYFAIAFGTVVFVGGLIAVLMCSSCDSTKCGKKGGNCNMEMSKDCSGSSCSKVEMGGHHGMKGSSHCEKGAMDCHHHKMKGSDKCEKGSKECCVGEMKEVKVIEKEVVIK